MNFSKSFCVFCLASAVFSCGVKGPPIFPGGAKQDYIKAYTRKQEIVPTSDKETDAANEKAKNADEVSQ